MRMRAMIKHAFPLKIRKCNLLATHSKSGLRYYMPAHAVHHTENLYVTTISLVVVYALYNDCAYIHV